MDGMDEGHLLRRRPAGSWPSRFLAVLSLVMLCNLALLGDRATLGGLNEALFGGAQMPLDGTGGEAAVAGIPLKIFQTGPWATWDESWPELSASMASTNPEFERVFFDDDAAAEFVRYEYGDTAVAEAFETCGRPVMRSDLFRLAVVAKLGGFYMDMDMLARSGLAPLTRLSEYKAVFPLEWWKDESAFRERHFRRALDEAEHWQVGNYAFGAAAQHPLVLDALDEAVKRSLALAGQETVSDLDVLRSTGPYMLSEVYHAGRLAGKYADVLLLRGDDAEPTRPDARGAKDWHKFGEDQGGSTFARVELVSPFFELRDISS